MYSVRSSFSIKNATLDEGCIGDFGLKNKTKQKKDQHFQSQIHNLANSSFTRLQ